MIRLLALATIVSIFGVNNLHSQTTQDTINQPYWVDMMLSNVNYFQTVRAYNLYFSNKEKIKGTGYKQFERWAENAKHRIDENGNFKPQTFLLDEWQFYKHTHLTSRGGNPKWVSLGPFRNPQPASMQRGVGRINAIGFHPTDENVLYAGAPAGGFWYSKDKGQNWIKSNTDELPSFGVSAIGVIPVPSSEPIILVGTGDRDANDAPGYGIYVSTDGGINFTPSNTGMGATIVNKILVNPLDNKVVVAATASGIFKSKDQGKNWARTTSGSNYKDIAYHPEDTSIMYATSGGSFYRSTNGGNSWALSQSGFSSSGRSRMAIAVTKANPSIVYVVAVTANTNDMEGFYKSSNQGQSFAKVIQRGNVKNPLGFNTNGGTGGQGWYDLAIDADPRDSNTVFVGGINIFKTQSAGDTFRCVAFWSYHPTIPWVHADIHCMVRNPLNNELYIGSDGGIDYTVNEGISYNNRNYGLAISQFYNLGVSQLSLTKFITGAQDNGTSTGNSSEDWTAEVAGDGMHCEISHFDTDIMFGSLYYGDIQRTRNNGTSWNRISSSISETGPWVTPYQVHPTVNDILVAVYNNVWVSKNAATGNTVSFIKTTNNITSEGSAIRFSNSNPNYVFVGWEDGNIRYSSNIQSASPTFSSMSNSMGVGGQINDIETSYNDVNKLYVARGTKIFKTANLGANWTNISGTLPNVNINCIVADKFASEGLYVGTDAGIYYKDSTMSDWILYSDGFSLNAPVRDIEIVYDPECSIKSKIFAATYGRGLWVNTVYVNTNSGDFTLTSDKGNEVCQGDKIELSASGGDNYSYEASSDISKTASDKFQLTASQSGQYKFYSKLPSGKCEVRLFDLTVNPLPNLTVNPTSKTINKGETVTISADGATDYAWSPSSFVIGGSTSSNTLEIRPDNTTAYTVEGTSDKGCKVTKKSTITVRGSNSILSSSQGITTEVYPNPASDFIDVKSKTNIKVSVWNIEGQNVLKAEEYKVGHKLHIKQLPIGLYQLEIETKSGLKEYYKFSIER